MKYLAHAKRYESMEYVRCGHSGLLLPKISLGLWHNFGGVDAIENARAMLCCAFDHGITHFDLANNYGPPPGSAESSFGHILKDTLGTYRDEMVISTKAGYHMWEGPYGDWGSRKYLVSSLDQSLKRMGLDYVDIFYHHRPDPETPLEETMQTLDHIVRSGKALYVGISNYNAEDTRHAVRLLRDLGTPCLIHQHSYSMLNRGVEDALLPCLEELQVGGIAFCPLAQGLLTNRYLGGVPNDSRAAKENTFLQQDRITDDIINKVNALNAIAQDRGQDLAQMALSWVMRQAANTSVLIGASKTAQIENCVGSLANQHFSQEELDKLEQILNS